MLMAQFAVAAEPYHLQPGDILEISVWKEPDLQREVLVRPDGGISFPLVGNMDASGKSIQDLTETVKAKLEQFIADPVVTVSLAQMLGNKVYVLGKVNKPGEFAVTRNVDVLQALSMAGGLNPFAQGDEIRVIRREDDVQETFAFRYGFVEKGDLTDNILLRSGDVILVP
jgi:polysaccharide export outer membrane protein